MIRDQIAFSWRRLGEVLQAMLAVGLLLGAAPAAAQGFDPCNFCIADEVEHFWRIPDHPRFQAPRRIAQQCTGIEFPLAQFKVTADGAQVSEFKVEHGVKGVCTSSLENPQPYFVDDSGNRVTDVAKYGVIEIISQSRRSVQFKYTNPIEHPPAGELSREIRIVIEYTRDTGEKVTPTTLLLQVFRPPVVMTHGLWSNQDAFKAMEDDLASGSQHYPEELLYRVDYSGTNGSAFSVNSREVEFGVLSVIEQALAEGYGVGKVDLVGHSMGGLLGRLFVQGANYHGEVRRVITCNTPHSGSQMANLLLDEIWDPLGVLCAALGATGSSCYDGAVCDLSVGSNALAALNQGAIGGSDEKYHALATVFDMATNAPGGSISSFAPFSFSTLLIQALGACSVPALVDRVFNNDDSDLIVAATSQAGGLAQTRTSLFENQVHMGSTDNSLVKEAVRSLLDEPDNSSRFATGGYHPATLVYAPTSMCGAIIQPPSSGRSQGCSTARHSLALHSLAAPALTITAPLSGTTLGAGQGFAVTVTGSSDVATVLLLLSKKDGEFFLAKKPGPTATFAVTVPEALVGQETLVALGLNAYGQPFASSNPVAINVTVAAQLLALTVDPPTVYLEPGYPRRLTVTGTFDDGIVRDLSEHPGMTFAFAAGHASQAGTNGVTLNTRQDDEVTITYLGVSAPAVPIHALPEAQPVYPKKPVRRRLPTR
jgi:pimeloyl-ACP methyl ester carboxylesterase